MMRLFSSKYIYFLKTLFNHNKKVTIKGWDKKDENSVSAFSSIQFWVPFIIAEFSELWDFRRTRTRDLRTELRDTFQSARASPI